MSTSAAVPWTLRLLRIVPAAWLGLMVAVGSIATPIAFAMLERAQAGTMVAEILSREARFSLVLGMVTVLLARGWIRQAAGDSPTAAVTRAARPVVWLALAAVASVVVGYYALQEPMQAARSGQSVLTFGQWHAVSVGFFGLRAVLAAVIAWRVTRVSL